MRTDSRARARACLSAVAVGLLVVLGPASASVADPTVPPDQALQQARSAEAAGVSAVADIEIQLAQQSVVRDTAAVTAAAAGEAFLVAQQRQVDAVAAASAAATMLATADVQMEASRRTLVAIALAASRSGGAIDGVQAFLSADGFEEIVQRSTALSHLGAKADRAVQELRASTIVAEVLKGRADASSATAATASAAADAALAAANQAQVDADASVAASSVQRDALIVQLAAARSTTVEIERARQDQLDADNVARANAAAQAARTAAPTPSSAARPVAAPAAGPAPAPAPAPAPPTPSNPRPPIVTPSPAPPAPAAPGAGSGSSRGSAAQGAAAVAWASTQLGLPYGWGATGPDAYDCSGLTGQAWLHAGRAIARTAGAQYAQVLKISYNDLRPGDLIFWGTSPTDASTVYHVAMYAGNGQIIEAARPGVLTRITPMTYRWASTMAYAGRP